MKEDILLYYFRRFHTLLCSFERKFGPLTLLSSRDKKKISYFNDKVTKLITMCCNNSIFNMYNVIIFMEDVDFETKFTSLTKDTILMYAKLYNYLLLNTNFFSQNLLKKDVRLGHLVNFWPTISPYFFLQIILHLKCEDLLVESLAHIPLDLCLQILEITIVHINELEFSRAVRLTLLLIYKIYYKFLWLHLDTISEENATRDICQLTKYFENLSESLVNFVASPASTKNKYFVHGVLVKNMLRYTKKCMQSKIESISKKYNLAKLFTLTYGNFNEHMNYMLPANKVKSIVLELEEKLAILLLNQIERIYFSEFIAWRCICDDENSMMSLQYAILMECHNFTKFMRQNEFLVSNKYLSYCLEQLTVRIINRQNSNKFTLTVPKLCQEIAQGQRHRMKELIKRYKEWDLFVMDFIYERIELLTIYDVFDILEYCHHIFAYLRTETEKYRVYISVLKILMQLTVDDMDLIVENYIKLHFYDNPLEYLYNDNYFVEFVEGTLLDYNERDDLITTQNLRIFLIFILLNPKQVLIKFLMYEISSDFDSVIFQDNMIMSLVQSYYGIRYGHFNMLLYILEEILFQQPTTWCRGLTIFLENALFYEMISADDLINKLYIKYLTGGIFHKTTLYFILSHLESILKRELYTLEADILSLLVVLMKMTSLLRRYKSVSKAEIHDQMNIISEIMLYFRTMDIFDKKTNKYFCDYILEPLDMNKIWPMTNTLQIIREYERRIYVVHQQLRTDRRCHPKLRSYVQSFNLDRETIVRYMLLHCLQSEYEVYAFDLTFIFFHHFGWNNQIMAYENVMRITVEASQLVLMFVETFPKNMFITCLYTIVQFCKIVEGNMMDNYEAVRHVLLKTLFSMNIMISKTPYGNMYNLFLKRVQEIDPYLSRAIYFDKIFEFIHMDLYTVECKPLENCTCNRSLCCKNHNMLMGKKVLAMYKAYLFIYECIKLSNMEIWRTNIRHYSERLMHNLCLK